MSLISEYYEPLRKSSNSAHNRMDNTLMRLSKDRGAAIIHVAA